MSKQPKTPSSHRVYSYKSSGASGASYSFHIHRCSGASGALRMKPDTYYVWVGGSCDYGHEERCSGGAYIMERNDAVIASESFSDRFTTEFRMILTAMIHAMQVVNENSDIVFLTNVSYIQQNFDREPTEKSSNADLISECIKLKDRHNSVSVKIVPFHKYSQLLQTHDMARDAMLELRNKSKKS